MLVAYNLYSAFHLKAISNKPPDIYEAVYGDKITNIPANVVLNCFLMSTIDGPKL
jgi:hypothetical protein